MILSYPVISSGKFGNITGSFEALLGADSSDPEKKAVAGISGNNGYPPTFLLAYGHG